MIDRVLVTGGTGYIGSHTAVELINDGFGVVVVDDLSNSEKNVLDGIEKITGVRPEFEQFDLCDRSRTQVLFEKYPDIVAVIHFAAYKAVGESVEKPLDYYRNNLLSLVNLLDTMSAAHVGNLVFSSSCTVYGQPEKLPVTEDAPVAKATSPYGNTKQISEEIIEDTVRAGASIKSISLRYFNPIGAHESALIGELPRGVPNCLVPYVTQTAAGVREQLSIFGDDYGTSDGTCIRDYINVVDLARAHISAIRRLLDGRNKARVEYFNIGTGQGVSVSEVVNTFERVTGQKLNYKVVGRRAGDIEQVWADTTLANRELGWRAEKTLEETLLSAWNWEKQYRGLA